MVKTNMYVSHFQRFIILLYLLQGFTLRFYVLTFQANCLDSLVSPEGTIHISIVRQGYV